MTNIIERALEAFAFVLLVAGAIALWSVTPAHAFIYDGSSGKTCYETSDGHGGTYYACN